MYYIITIVALLAFELLYFWMAKRLHIVDRPNERSSHHRVALLGAGILFYVRSPRGCAWQCRLPPW